MLLLALIIPVEPVRVYLVFHRSAKSAVKRFFPNDCISKKIDGIANNSRVFFEEMKTDAHKSGQRTHIQR